MTKTKKIIVALLIGIILITVIFPNTILAFDTTGLGELDNYAGDGGSSENFDKIVNNVISIIQVVASVVSVATLAAIGIKYMMSGISERANYKKTMLPYIIGAILVFATSNIVAVIYELSKKMVNLE